MAKLLPRGLAHKALSKCLLLPLLKYEFHGPSAVWAFPKLLAWGA